MTAQNAKIQWDSINKKASFQSSAAITLYKNGTLTITLLTTGTNAFPSDATITGLTIYNWDASKPNNQGTEVGSWTASDNQSTGLSNYYTVSGSSTSVTITDAESFSSNNGEKDFALKVSGTVPGGTWNTDPELINKAGTGT